MSSEISLSISPFNLPTNPTGPDPTPTYINQKTVTIPLPSLSPSLSSLSSLPSANPSLYSDLLLDSEITDSPLLPRTFLIKPSDITSHDLTYFEYLALKILHHHTKSMTYDNDTNLTAEYWFQIRPSDTSTSRQSPSSEIAKNGISFHYDKDETLHAQTGVHIFPHVSTVTYLTDVGGPTMVIDNRLEGLGGLGGEGEGSENLDVDVIFPKIFKHMSFDGRKLHGGDSSFVEGSSNFPLTDEQISKGYKLRKQKDKSLFKTWFKTHVRVTFLVNVWIYHVPSGLERMNEFYRKSMVSCEKGLGRNVGGENGKEEFPGFMEGWKGGKEEFVNGEITETPVKSTTSTSDSDLQKFTYSLGQTNGMEEIYVGHFPIQRIRDNAKNGKDSKIVWEDGDMSKIVVEKSSKKSKTE